MFKIYDRVTVTAISPYFRKEGEITRKWFSPILFQVQFDDGDVHNFPAESLALVSAWIPQPPTGVMHVPAFTVGDRVVVTNHSDPYYAWEGEIKAIDSRHCEVEFVKGALTITHVYSHQNLAPAPTSHSKKPEPEISPQCHDEKSYDGGSILDITKRMF